ncbi:hypothetical protein VNO77_02278 [Canavalia gladiata]|uniref:Uncharacterized protein n=1 Tax=Canavalia gladiata TaxID=3824 RepID=A0AAN9MSP3_CANGL
MQNQVPILFIRFLRLRSFLPMNKIAKDSLASKSLSPNIKPENSDVVDISPSQNIASATSRVEGGKYIGKTKRNSTENIKILWLVWNLLVLCL